MSARPMKGRRTARAIARRGASTQNLLQVMPQVPDVIFNNKTERHRRVIADRAGHSERVLRDARDDAQQVQVVGSPECDQIAPRRVGVAVALDPGFLLVAGECMWAVELRADET